jgi:hypothetical protein
LRCGNSYAGHKSNKNWLADSCRGENVTAIGDIFASPVPYFGKIVQISRLA